MNTPEFQNAHDIDHPALALLPRSSNGKEIASEEGEERHTVNGGVSRGWDCPHAPADDDGKILEESDSDSYSSLHHDSESESVCSDGFIYIELDNGTGGRLYPI